MAMTRAILVALALSLFIEASANAGQLLDGNKLYDSCEGYTTQAVPGEQAVHFSYCSGYIVGVADSLFGQGAICTPAGVNAVQLVGIVINYLSAHPERRHYSQLLGRRCT